MDIRSLIAGAVSLARTASSVIPGMAEVQGAIAIGEKIADLVSDLTNHAPDTASKAELEAAHKQLVATVTAKANATADRLDG